MGKPPTTDQELSARVAALEERADATDAELADHGQEISGLHGDVEILRAHIASLDARVTALEGAGGVILPRPPQPQYPIDPAYGVPEGERPDHTLPEPEPPDEIEEGGGNYAAIEFGDQLHYFYQDRGTDLGDYVGPHFTQRCIRATCDTLPGFSVMFRPDADGNRQEVVFELGAIWPTQPAANLGAYDATICLDEQTPVIVAVPHHNWFGRWRWQSAPRPVIAEVRDLIAAGLLPHYDATVGGGHTPPSQPRHYAGPMDLAGIEPYMPSTGGRDDIGLVTECQADYLCTGSPQALNSLLAQLEGSGTLTWHYRDENTGAPLDTFQWPRASSYDWQNGAPDPYIPKPVGDGGGITLDTSHHPDLAYVPFLLTGDPYALEELQFTVNYNVTTQPADSRNTYNMGGALRAHAWALRCMARCARVTPATTPAWLLNQLYFQRLLDGNRDYVATYAAAGLPHASLSVLGDVNWGTPPEGNIQADCANSPWWEDYEQAVMGHVVEMGFTDWMPNYEWKIQNAVDRASGKSGWNRSQAATYRIAVRSAKTAPFYGNWQECWDGNLALGGVVQEADPNHLLPGDMAYPMQLLACLAIAKGMEIDGAAEAHEWLQAEVLRLSTPQNFVYHRWSIA